MTANHRIYPFAPLNIAVGATSIMIVPPIRDALDPSRVNAWTAGDVYPQGSIVRSNKRYYWSPVAGTAGTTAPTHLDGDASDDGMIWRVVRGLREVLSLTNLGSGSIFIARGYPAVVSMGVVLPIGGSLNEGYENGLVRPYEGAYYAISDSSATLAISEG